MHLFIGNVTDDPSSLKRWTVVRCVMYLQQFTEAHRFAGVVQAAY